MLTPITDNKPTERSTQLELTIQDTIHKQQQDTKTPRQDTIRERKKIPHKLPKKCHQQDHTRDHLKDQTKYLLRLHKKKIHNTQYIKSHEEPN